MRDFQVTYYNFSLHTFGGGLHLTLARLLLPPLWSAWSLRPFSFYLMVLVLPRGHTECISLLKYLLYQPCSRHWCRKESDTVPAPRGHIGLSSNNWFKANSADKEPSRMLWGEGLPSDLRFWSVLGEGPSGAGGMGWRVAGIVKRIPVSSSSAFTMANIPSFSLSTHIYLLFWGEPFEVRWQASCFFTPKSFSICCLRIRTLSI